MIHDYQQELNPIKALLRQNPGGMSITGIAKALKKNKNTTGRYLDILLISGQVDMRKYGMTKVFTLSQRVPISAMLSYSKELIIILDTESIIIDVNNSFLSLLNLTRREVIGKKLAQVKSPSIDIHNLKHNPSAPLKKSNRVISFQVIGAGERIFELTKIPSVFDDGTEGITIILSEITREIIKEREIREREERFRMMAENIQDGLAILENGKSTFANSRIAEILGYSFEELGSMDIISIIAPADREFMESRIELLKDFTEGNLEFQTLIRKKDRTERQVYVRITGFRHGDILYHFLVMTDVTEFISRESAIRGSNQRFRMMAENIQDGLIIIENEQVIFVNQRLCEITGYTKQELRMINTQDLFSPDDWQRIEHLFHKSMTGTAPHSIFKGWIRCKNKDMRYLHGHINSVQQGEATITYFTVTDVTAFAQREQELLTRIGVLETLNPQT